MHVDLIIAYSEACQALGEEVVKGRLLTQVVKEQEAEIEELKTNIEEAKENGFLIEEAEKTISANGNGVAVDQTQQQG